MYENIREEELKIRISETYFPEFDCAKIIGNIDFSVTIKKEFSFLETESVLWAEAKKGKADIFNSITQLILTVGKARTFEQTLPPAYLGAFDAEKIAFIPYNYIQEIFYLNDFNWNVAPSNYETKEFKMVLEKARAIIETNSLQFFYENDDQELREFIENNFISGKFGNQKIRIDKNNFITIYNKWLNLVKPTIAVNWALVKKIGIIDGDFYLADLLSSENESLKDNLYVLLKKNHYELDRKLDELGLFNFQKTSFLDKQKAHQIFWNKYERPPKTEYWDYIVERRDLLVPQDVRERKGSFFTPQIWVELSQRYLADVLGENWQDEYYIWDCAAGTGNLLTGLTNKNRIWASTLDRQDVDVMRDRILNGANLLENHVFQFDFLNDSFDKLPNELQEIVNDPEKRKKLVIYINPPYAEASATDTISGNKRHKSGVSTNKIYKQYFSILGRGINEIFAQFLIRIYMELNGVILANFSKLKILQSQNFSNFRQVFLAKLKKCFMAPSDTFDNVKGKFPIGFFIWDSSEKEKFSKIKIDIFDGIKKWIGKKNIVLVEKNKVILNWMQQFYDKKGERLAYMVRGASDFQNNRIVFVTTNPSTIVVKHSQTHNITKNNLIQNCIFFAVRKSIKATWLNDRDQFLYPNKKWEKDKEFQSNCLAYTLFNNNISSKYGVNHWIPFTETEVDSMRKFDSNFMTDFINGKIKDDSLSLLPKKTANLTANLEFSAEAKTVFDAGRNLWIHYHQTIKDMPILGEIANVNASLYDIREYFQGRNEKGRMNSSSADEKYNELMAILRAKMQVLANKIEPKIYEYGFLKG
ncbi:MAG: hypothetical protein EAZ97_05695 [Bacteroidetes bacterium]|nr:MAG: hypothetical protein EAZ97_05695 [Bacteroidota bacterium]